MSVKLGNLVYDWIQNNQNLKEHLNISLFGDGFYIETKCGGHFTLAWVANNYHIKIAPTLSEPWKEVEYLNPADPQYFNKLEARCRHWHNTYGAIYAYACKTEI